MGLSQFLPAEVVTVLMLLPVSPLTVDVVHGSELSPTCRGLDNVHVVICFSPDS